MFHKRSLISCIDKLIENRIKWKIEFFNNNLIDEKERYLTYPPSADLIAPGSAMDNELLLHTIASTFNLNLVTHTSSLYQNKQRSVNYLLS